MAGLQHEGNQKQKTESSHALKGHVFICSSAQVLEKKVRFPSRMRIFI